MHEAAVPNPAPAPAALPSSDMSQPSVGNGGVDLIQSFPFSDLLGGFEIDAVRLPLASC